MLVDIISQIREEVVALAPCLHIRLTWVQPLVKVTAFASLMPKIVFLVSNRQTPLMDPDYSIYVLFTSLAESLPSGESRGH